MLNCPFSCLTYILKSDKKNSFKKFIQPKLQILVSDSLKLEVGKEYNLNNVKEIIPTDDFLTLNRKIIRCQIEESSNECKTRQYINTMIDQCGCLPFSIGNINQVPKNLISLVQIHPRSNKTRQFKNISLLNISVKSLSNLATVPV